jgi:HEAT repeat protein
MRPLAIALAGGACLFFVAGIVLAIIVLRPDRDRSDAARPTDGHRAPEATTGAPAAKTGEARPGPATGQPAAEAGNARPGPGSVAHLIKGLGSADAAERARACNALAELGPNGKPACKDLCRVMLDGHRRVVEAAAAAVDKIDPDTHELAVALIANADDFAALHPTLRKVLLLGKDAHALSPIVLRILTDNAVRLGVNRSGHPPRNGAEGTVVDSVYALGAIDPDDPDVSRAVLALLRSLNMPAQYAAVRELYHFKTGKSALAALSLIARTAENEDLRTSAIDDLVTIADEANRAAIEDLLEQLRRDRSPRIRTAVEVALDRLTNGGGRPVAQGNPRGGRGGWPVAQGKPRDAQGGRPAADRKPPQEHQPPPPRDPQADARLAQLIKNLKSKKASDRIKAADTIGAMGENAKDARQALCDAMLDTNREVLLAVSSALEKLDPALHKPVFILVVDGNGMAQIDALRTLAALGREGNPALSVVLAFARTHPAALPVVIGTLAAIAPEDRRVLRILLSNLQDTGPRAMRGGYSACLTAIDALPRTPFKKEAVKALIPLLDPSHSQLVRLAAAQALGEIGAAAKDATKSLKAMTIDPSARMRAAAAAALQKIEQAGDSEGKAAPGHGPA